MNKLNYSFYSKKNFLMNIVKVTIHLRDYYNIIMALVRLKRCWNEILVIVAPEHK